jgi:hypothetical protein
MSGVTAPLVHNLGVSGEESHAQAVLSPVPIEYEVAKMRTWENSEGFAYI